MSKFISNPSISSVSGKVNQNINSLQESLRTEVPCFNTVNQRSYNSNHYDSPNGSLFISILLHNSEFRVLNSEFRNLHYEFRNLEFGIVKYI